MAVFQSVAMLLEQTLSKLNRSEPSLSTVTGCSGLLDQLNALNLRLEEIQKSLDMYLETKRQIFPRFYFISNDDLLEILGQSKNPMEIQVHLKKCFDNIKSLNMSRASY